MQFNWTQTAAGGGRTSEGEQSSGRSIPGLGFYRYAAKQPNWVTRATFTVFAVVIAIPILLLFFLALLAAGVVFGGLSLLSAITGSFRRGIGSGNGGGGGGVGGRAASPKQDQAGRNNVRILPPKQGS